MRGFNGEETLIIKLEDGREIQLPYMHNLDSLRFQWEEYHCGDTEVEETPSITLEELFRLLTMKETEARALADEVLRKELQSKEAEIIGWGKKDEIRSKEMAKIRDENEALRKTIKIVS